MAATLRHITITTQGEARDTLTLPEGDVLAAVLDVRSIGPDLQWRIVTRTQEGGAAEDR